MEVVAEKGRSLPPSLPPVPRGPGEWQRRARRAHLLRAEVAPHVLGPGTWGQWQQQEQQRWQQAAQSGRARGLHSGRSGPGPGSAPAPTPAQRRRRERADWPARAPD